MLSTRTHILAALAQGISAGDDFAARLALDRVDPVLRGAARRRLGRSLLDAELSATEAGIDHASRDHVMRLAALAVARRPAPVANDVAAVAAAYAALPPVTPRRAPILTIAVLAIVLGSIGALVFTIATHHAAPRTYARPLPVPSASAYKLGGVPLHEPAIDVALDKPLTELVVAAGRARDDGSVSFGDTLAKLRKTELGHGPALAAAWQHALDAYGKAVTAAELGATSRDEVELREAVRELTAQFSAVGLGYFLEGRFKNGYAYIQAYRVDEVVFVVTNGAPRRVLSISRLDHLNTAYAVLGMQAEDVGDPVLHVERIAEYVATSELPVLAPDAPYPLADAAFLATPEGAALAVAVGVAIRREYAAALGRDGDAGTQIARLLVERAGIIDQWRTHLGHQDVVFSKTDDLFVSPVLLKALDGSVPHYQLERVEAIDGVLADLEAPRIHARIHDLVAATVRRHEAQHGFDFERSAELRYPARLSEMLGPAVDEAGDEVYVVTSARHELAAYLSQVINDPLTPHASLWHLAQQTFTADRAGTGEFYAGVVVLEGLARTSGVADATPTYDRSELAKRALAVAKLSDDQLRAAAVKLWRELFGEAPTVIVDTPRTF